MSKPYLDEAQKDRAKMCIRNIADKMLSVDTEISQKEKSYKSYLLEKLESIRWDVQVLMSMCEDDEDERDEDNQ